MKKCLLTGSSGFIGLALRKKLTEKGFIVKTIHHNYLHQQKKLKQIISAFSPNYIFHLATYGNKYSQNDDLEIIRANIIATVNLLYATANINYEAFINTGSSSEYGTKSKQMSESDSLDTDTFYGVTKASATLLCRAYAKKYSKPVVTTRPFSVYGPHDDINKFIQVAIRSFQDNSILKLASGVHDWIYVDDYINGILKVAKNAQTLKGRAVNIGTGIQSTNHEVIKTLEKIFRKKIKIIEINRVRIYDTNISWKADNSLLKSLGWLPKYSLKRGLMKTMNEDNK
ncbi:MAG: NAD(P)-dependent oxidoreductase [Candidatus Daviesbacteria bacterium]|nr:NAD(P)-dependent oxidoreductase [Candidatus Daviesbacteria bacterium]